MIVVDIEKCSGCSRCEVHCSFFHSGKISRGGARIKVVKLEAIGIDFPVVCRQCKERYCMKCPESALTIGDFGQVVVSPTLCTLCETCEKLCPIGAMEIDEEIPHVCDLCGGEPRCVEACTPEAVRYQPHLTGAVSLKKFSATSRGLSPEVKRVRYAETASRALREKWMSKRSA